MRARVRVCMYICVRACVQLFEPAVLNAKAIVLIVTKDYFQEMVDGAHNKSIREFKLIEDLNPTNVFCLCLDPEQEERVLETVTHSLFVCHSLS